MNTNLINMTLSELENIFLSINQKKYRAKQVFSWFYKKNIFDLNLMSNLPENLKLILSQEFTINIPQIHTIDIAKDNSYKFLLKTCDENLIEAILMPQANRITLCVSCMIGCPLKCKFCATGSELKFIRKLDTSEIVGQFIAIQNYINQKNLFNPNKKITNVVFMGMGEPLLNLDNINKSLDIFLHNDGLGLSKNKITISTAGITRGLSELINKYKIKLAISLHFPTDKQRELFMPINKKYSLSNLLAEAKKVKLIKREYITIEYLMLNKINDTLEHAKKLVKLLNTLKVKINLIPYNPTKTLPCTPSTENSINLFANYLRTKKIMVTVRRSKGKNINGGCGQFILSKTKGKV